MSEKQRFYNIDILRGLVMVLMVIDHTQEYQAGPGRGLVTDPMNLAITPGLVYFWRILAHFCAPTFALLMGMSAYLSRASQGRMFWRGVMLLGLEATVMNWAWTFNPLWHRYFFQVIAALGCGLIALAGVSRLGLRVVGILGVVLVFGHNLLDGIGFAAGTWQHYVWSILHVKNVLPLWGGFEFRTTYPILPVVGLAFCGYALGMWMEEKRRLWKLGVLVSGLFIVLRATGIYGDPHAWDGSLASFFNVTKYPLSLQFMLMTLGPALLLLDWLRDKRQGWLEQLGRTPMFFYVAHLVLLHAAALMVGVLLGGKIDLATRFGGVPDVVHFPVWATAGWALAATTLLWPVCRAYEQWRQRGRAA
jgi:uncharacterized membrane protein